MKNNKIILSLLIIAVILLGAVIGVLSASHSTNSHTAEPTKKVSEQAAEAPGLSDKSPEAESGTSKAASASEPEQSTQPETETVYSDGLSEFLSSENLKLSDGITAFISASCEQNSLTLYLKDGAVFHKALSCYAWFGMNGVSDSKKEGDMCTPCGLFDLGTAFGLDNNPGTGYPFKKITENSYWIDDPESRFYNQWVELTDDTDKDWSSAEKLSNYPDRYNYGFVIEYNTVNTVPGKGSAIFLHCGNRSTLGCIAISSDDMQKLLLNMQKEDKAQIYIY